MYFYIYSCPKTLNNNLSPKVLQFVKINQCTVYEQFVLEWATAQKLRMLYIKTGGRTCSAKVIFPGTPRNCKPRYLNDFMSNEKPYI